MTAPETCILHQFTTSPYCAKVRLSLDSKGIAYRTCDLQIGRKLRRQLNALGPSGTVPVLELPDQRKIQGSSAILRALDQLQPHPPLYPAPPPNTPAQAATIPVSVWESWADDSLSFLLRAVALKAGTGARLLQDLLQPLSALSRWSIARAIERRTAQRLKAQGIAAQSMGELLTRLNEHLAFAEQTLTEHKWLAGQAFTAADAAVGGQCEGMKKIDQFTALISQHPRFTAWLNRLHSGDLTAAEPAAALSRTKPAAGKKPANKNSAAGKTTDRRGKGKSQP